ncbi:hypothetical protein SAMN05216328_12856 [Ensifer sp. YR511]|nr:hypothetical protein SAMN05216328_12856 [Ensifer sp. YR511]
MGLSNQVESPPNAAPCSKSVPLMKVPCRTSGSPAPISALPSPVTLAKTLSPARNSATQEERSGCFCALCYTDDDES